MPSRIETCEARSSTHLQLSVTRAKRAVGKVTRITYAVEKREDDQSGPAVVSLLQRHQQDRGSVAAGPAAVGQRL
jgi:hypothetical protein